MAAQLEATTQSAHAVAATPARSGAAVTGCPQLRALARCLDLPVFGGNRVEVLAGATDGRAAVFDAIDRAGDHINVEGWVWMAGADGEQLAQRLLVRAHEGVHINLLLDGSPIRGVAPVLERLRRSGARVCEVPPAQPAWQWLHDVAKPSERARALLVVDGRIAFIGSDPAARPAAISDVRGAARMVRVEGPAVGELQWLFVECWRRRVPTPMQSGRYFPALAWAGPHRVGIALPGSRDASAAHTRALLAAVDAARDRALLIGSHGLRHNALHRALIAACHRGVDVHLLLPGDDEPDLFGSLRRALCASLLHAGVHVHALRDAAPGAHASVIDGIWSSLEPSPIAQHRARSAGRDRLIVHDAEFGAQAEAAFWSDVARASDALIDRAWRPSPLRRLNLRLSRYLEVSP